MTINLPERCYCADVVSTYISLQQNTLFVTIFYVNNMLQDYPMAVVGTASRGLIVYQLEGSPREYKTVELSLKYQYRCVAIFRDKKKVPTGFAIGSTEGRVAIHHLNLSSKENFTFKCHRTNGTPNGYQDIYAVGTY